MAQVVSPQDAGTETGGPGTRHTGGAPRAGFLRSLMRSRTGFAGFLIFTAITLTCLIGPLFIPDRLPTNLKQIYAPPSLAHPFGFDNEGRDVFLQVIAGGWDVIYIGILAASISTVIAVAFGALAAYVGGWLDSVIVTAADIVLSVPAIVLLAVLAAFVQLDSVSLLAVLLGVLGWPGLLRAVRAQVFSLKEREYIEAAKLLDLGTPHIVLREILPNMASYILMNFVIGMTGAIYGVVGLYLLGLAPMAGGNWGILLNKAWVAGAMFNEASLWWVMGPVLAITVLQLALVMMTRSFEEILNPRLRHN